MEESPGSRKLLNRKPQGRHAHLIAALSRLEREHLALLLAICELESRKDSVDHESRILESALYSMLYEDLRHAQHALAHAARGAYGSCANCHKSLPIRELGLRPATTLCPRCSIRMVKSLQ